MAYTKRQIEVIAVAAPVTSFAVGSPVTIVAGDPVQVSLEKAQAQINQLQVQVGAIQVGNNLFNYYNFK